MAHLMVSRGGLWAPPPTSESDMSCEAGLKVSVWSIQGSRVVVDPDLISTFPLITSNNRQVFLVGHIKIILILLIILAQASALLLGAIQAVDNNISDSLFSLFISSISSPSFILSQKISNRMALRIKKKIWRKLMTAPLNLWVQPFPDLLGHFWASWWPFWIFLRLWLSSEVSN